MNVNIDELKQWIGRTEVVTEEISMTPLKALAAILDREGSPQESEPIPPCWHWLYFLPLHRQSEIGPDGHPRRGGFLPPVPLPRRMWAGSRLEFLRPLHVRDVVTRSSRIEDVSEKNGRSGPLVFVRVRHEIGDGASPAAVVEEQNIVYREMPKHAVHGAEAAVAAPAAPDAQWTREIHANEVLLFRFSAVTFNSHRIHYDYPYATDIEKYPGLVVQGPLIATLLLELLHQNHAKASVAHFTFRAMAPLFSGSPFKVCGSPEGSDENSVHLWAQRADGIIAMDAVAKLA